MQKPSKLAQIPQIRFAGFTEDWERRKLEEVAENTYGGGTPQTSVDSFWNGDIPWIQSQNIIENQLFDVVPQKYISEEAVLKSATKLIPKNSIAIVTRVGVGKLAFMPFSYCTSQDFLSLSGIRIDKKFAVYSIYKMLQKEKENVQGTSIKGITIEELLSKNIELPCNNAEQTKIGELFANLDNLITLHQRKVEKLQKIKKSCLQNLFPQNNQNTPKIRFKNFSDEWVENKYKNIGQCLSGGTLSYEDLDKNGIYKCILYGELYTRYDYIIKNIVFRTNKLGNKVIKNDILFPQSTTVDAMSLISPACMNDDEAQTSGVFAIRPHKNIDGNFITYYTKGNFYQRNKLAKNAQGLTIVHLYYQSIKDETILIPNLAEQCKISDFFSKLDKLITLHQRKVEKLKNIKKALLNKMFI
ncbi:restriction endonuclease subunit S [Campylobacter vicugnae]|uniref:restriction endonuclease subunit S n=1 Tax=Campylobacter vicugnae TaxID=1660076 RepID=UPI000A333DC2|nr:restriction endonuclease subunit S [Campylobacter sp. RM8965]